VRETLIDLYRHQAWADAELEQALLQAAMHSHYHRAQNATRLR
jgi:hypothetical protein